MVDKIDKFLIVLCYVCILFQNVSILWNKRCTAFIKLANYATRVAKLFYFI